MGLTRLGFIGLRLKGLGVFLIGCIGAVVLNALRNCENGGLAGSCHVTLSGTTDALNSAAGVMMMMMMMMMMINIIRHGYHQEDTCL